MLAMQHEQRAPAKEPRFNFADRAYFFFFITVSITIALRSGRLEQPWVLVGINALCCLLIFSLAQLAPQSLFWRVLHDWYPQPIFVVCFEEVSRLSFLFRDHWQDRYLLALEERLFSVPPTVWLGHHGSPLITELVEIGYFSYFILVFIVGGAFYGTGRRHAFRQLIDSTVFSYLCCYLVFLIFPTEGPAHTLAAQHNFPIPGGGPFHWAVRLIQTNAGVHGNAFPSVHVAGAVVSLYFAWRYMPKLGMFLTPLIALLCIGAVYDRYHYLTDVFGGFVFGLVPAWVVARGWVGTPMPEDRPRSPTPPVERYTQA
jgi:membrane-associated phospholipid phosphatase